MHELAVNPDIQHRVHEEIDAVLEKYDGQVTYDSISEMKYLEACIDGEQSLDFIAVFFEITI